MPSTFFGLNIASSGLSAYQVALNTTANNIANVQTTGYSRQQSNRVASDALLVHQQYGAVGSGVTTLSVKQIRNQNTIQNTGTISHRSDCMRQN